MNECREKRELTLIDHIRELRSRIIWSLGTVIGTSVLAYWFYENILNVLYRPFEILENGQGTALYATSLFEGFAVRIKISILAGVILALPVILYHTLKFVIPALNSPERRFLGWGISASAALVVGGAVYSYYWIVPLCVKFMTDSEFIPKQVGVLLSFEQNIFYILQFILVMTLVFQLPIILLALMAMGILSRKTLLRSGRYLVVVFFIGAALITPPDVVSQVAVAVPLVGLFYLSIWVAKVFGWGRSE